MSLFSWRRRGRRDRSQGRFSNTGPLQVAFETMETRRLFSTYAVPAGHSNVYIEGSNLNPGTIYVSLDSPFNAPVATFTASSNSVTATSSGITFHDISSAYQKQGMTIDFTTGGSSTVEIDAGANDQEIDISPTGTGASSLVTDATNSATGTDSYGSGITTLHVVTNDAGGATLNCESFAQTLVVDTGSGTGDTINLGSSYSEGSVMGAVINTGAGSDAVNLASDEDDVVSATIDFGNNPGAGNSLSLVGSSLVTAYLDTPQAIDSLSVSGGLVELNQSGRWNTNTFGTISISYGTLDVGAQDILVTNMSDSDVRSLIANAYNSGYWTGSGITSSYAVSDPSDYAVGYATYSDAISGLGLSSGQVLVRPTRLGDADMNGTTGLSDYNILAANFNSSGTDWAQGDFNYDGTTDLTDYNDLAANFNQSFPT